MEHEDSVTLVSSALCATRPYELGHNIKDSVSGKDEMPGLTLIHVIFNTDVYLIF
jgi:hypothetical protein